MNRVTYSAKQREIQKAKNCTLATIDIDTPRGRMTWQGPLNDLGKARLEEFMDQMIRQAKYTRP